MNSSAKTNPARNSGVEFLRFVFCLIIVNYHFYSHFLKRLDFPNFFARGYMGDEFFFMISGFFLARAALQTGEKPALWNLGQLSRRIKKIAIPYYITWVFCFFGVRFTRALTGGVNKSILIDAANSIYELLFLEMFGFEKGLYSNDVSWFFSALLIVTFILGFLVARFNKSFVLYGAPLIALFSYGILSLNFDLLHNPYVLIPNTFFLKGFVRALAAVCVGICLNGIVDSKAFSGFAQTGKVGILRLVRAADLLLWALILAYMLYPFRTNTGEFPVQYDYLIVILMGAALIPVLGSLFSPAQPVRFSSAACALGKYAFYAYFGQAIFYSVDDLVYAAEIGIFPKALILNLSVILLSVLLYAADRGIKKVLGRKQVLYS